MSQVVPLPVTPRRAMNLAHWLTQNARRLPERTALVWGDELWRWRELDARVSALAAALAARGVGPGSTLLVHSRNSNEMFESMFAAFRLGAVWVPTNFRAVPSELVHMASVARSRVFLCQTDFVDHARTVCEAVPGTDVLWLRGSAAAPDEKPTVSQLIGQHLGTDFPNAAVEAGTPCWFLFTSGTTGKPKAAVLTHGQLACVVTNHLADLLPGTSCEDGALVVAPLSHGAGLHQLILAARGARTVLMPSDKLEPAQAFALIEQHRLSSLFTVPTILKILVEDPAVDQHDHSSLRHVVYAGAPMYEVDQKRALAKLGPVLVQYYGLGEVTGNITVLPPHEHLDAQGQVARAGTCGFERTGMQVSIQDDAGNELPAGETGEVCVIGPAVFAGYYDNPEANAKAFRNGWFRTGDIGHMDAQGYLYLTGRASDMYISGGSNIYPREIEEKILLHDDVAEVAVLGVPDAQWGEIGVAVCVRRPGTQLDEPALRQWLDGRVARYKMPKHIYFWEALPQSGYGKVPKRLVRDELARRGLPQAAASAAPAAPTTA
ncbi:acyl-CoA synthetase [Comamonadaceae bacterium OH2545_COT-014]|nr:acyl-CoA synthetase [Comamonadaceae bacterium OH2545_COT-014]